MVDSYSLPTRKLGRRISTRATFVNTSILILIFLSMFSWAASASANQPPQAINDTAATDEDTSVLIDVLANDSDPDGDPIQLVVSPIIVPPAHGSATRVSDTTVSYTPNANFHGTDTFRYRIGDGQAVHSAVVTVTVAPVNDKPVANDDSATTLTNVTVDVDVTANDSDPDGDPVTLITQPIVVAPQHGTATRLSGSTLRYVPSWGYAGTDTFQYEIGDGHGRRARAWVTITVDLNQRPVAVDDTASAAPSIAQSIHVTANDYDPDGDPVTLITQPIVSAPANGTAVRASGSHITYTANSGFSGTDTFEYEIGDGRGRRGRGWVTVTVANANPVAIADTASAAPGIGKSIHVTANDYDPDGHAVSLISQPIVTAPTNGSAVRTSASHITYTANTGFSGTDTFEYEIGDGHGRRARAWVTIAVANANPVAVNDAATVHGNTAITIQVTANDYDPDGHTVSLISQPIVTAPANGSAVKASASGIIYTPNSGFLGTDTFEYEIGDGHGRRARAWVTVSVTNLPPNAVNDTANTHVDTAKLIDVLANDSDPDGDPVTLSRIVSAPTHGAATLTGNRVRYVPHSGYQGNDSFIYEARDDLGGTDQATVSITVTNQPPIAINDNVSTDLDVAVAIHVTANDSDPDGDPVTLTSNPIVSAPRNGTATRVSASHIRYTPQTGFSGEDTFQYRVEDSFGGTDTARVTVTVVDAPPPEVSSITPREIPAGSVSTVTVTGINFENASAMIPASDGGGPVPLITNTTVAPGGTRMTVEIDARAPGSDGIFALAVENSAGLDAQDFRVLPSGPMIDLWTPSEVAPGNAYALAILGANLAGASVHSTNPGVTVTDLDSASDGAITGLLAVANSAPLGTYSLIVTAAGGGSESLELTVTGAPSGRLASTNLLDHPDVKSKIPDGTRAPALYMQAFAFRDGIPPADGPSDDDAAAGAPDRGFSCPFTFSRSFSYSFRIQVATLDRDGQLQQLPLDAMGLGELRSFGVLSVVFTAAVSVEIGFDFCSLSGFYVCVSGGVGAEVPGIQSIIFYFQYCIPGTGFSWQVSASGVFANFTFGSAGQCTSVRGLTGPGAGGRQFAEVEMNACCEEPVVIGASGTSFIGTPFQLSYQYDGFEITEARPDPNTCPGECSPDDDEGQTVGGVGSGFQQPPEWLQEDSAKGACIRTPFPPGNVSFTGCSAAQLDTFRVMPEDGTVLTRPDNGPTYGTDGLWVDGHTPRNEWFKIPGHCTAEITCNSGGWTWQGCCNACAIPFKGIVRWSQDAHPTTNPF